MPATVGPGRCSLQISKLRLIFPFQDLTMDDYLGIGLRNGMLHLVWNLGWFSRTELSVPKPKLNDGAWHKIKLNRVRQSLELLIDGEVFGSQVSGSYFELNTSNKVFIGKHAWH